MTWGVTFIGQRGQFEIGLKGSLFVGISTPFLTEKDNNNYRNKIATGITLIPVAISLCRKNVLLRMLTDSRSAICKG